ncbi:MAG: hypothetical protein LBH55_03445 [Mycoplasmataceae bacterium]|nr:hypothetical protein [Mycoplasmataceae bacterium]
MTSNILKRDIFKRVGNIFNTSSFLSLANIIPELRYLCSLPGDNTKKILIFLYQSQYNCFLTNGSNSAIINKMIKIFETHVTTHDLSKEMCKNIKLDDYHANEIYHTDSVLRFQFCQKYLKKKDFDSLVNKFSLAFINSLKIGKILTRQLFEKMKIVLEKIEPGSVLLQTDFVNSIKSNDFLNIVKHNKIIAQMIFENVDEVFLKKTLKEKQIGFQKKDLTNFIAKQISEKNKDLFNTIIECKRIGYHHALVASNACGNTAVLLHTSIEKNNLINATRIKLNKHKKMFPQHLNKQFVIVLKDILRHEGYEKFKNMINKNFPNNFSQKDLNNVAMFCKYFEEKTLFETNIIKLHSQLLNMNVIKTKEIEIMEQKIAQLERKILLFNSANTSNNNVSRNAKRGMSLSCRLSYAFTINVDSNIATMQNEINSLSTKIEQKRQSIVKNTSRINECIISLKELKLLRENADEENLQKFLNGNFSNFVEQNTRIKRNEIRENIVNAKNSILNSNASHATTKINLRSRFCLANPQWSRNRMAFNGFSLYDWKNMSEQEKFLTFMHQPDLFLTTDAPENVVRAANNELNYQGHTMTRNPQAIHKRINEGIVKPNVFFAHYTNEELLIKFRAFASIFDQYSNNLEFGNILCFNAIESAYASQGVEHGSFVTLCPKTTFNPKGKQQYTPRMFGLKPEEIRYVPGYLARGGYFINVGRTVEHCEMEIPLSNINTNLIDMPNVEINAESNLNTVLINEVGLPLCDNINPKVLKRTTNLTPEDAEALKNKYFTTLEGLTNKKILESEEYQNFIANEENCGVIEEVWRQHFDSHFNINLDPSEYALDFDRRFIPPHPTTETPTNQQFEDTAIQVFRMVKLQDVLGWDKKFVEQPKQIDPIISILKDKEVDILKQNT